MPDHDFGKNKDIRATFLNFFQKADHTIVPSSSLVPHNDPTLLFTNSGMVQFKEVFTGQEKKPYSRAVTSQKCLRAGGKHNDLDQVGYTARHHTFFEMLGNFSFGDYFKQTAIELAWTLITKEFGLSKDRLCVTVYAEDEEAFSLWKKIAGLTEHKIIPIATSDNFWSMGDRGPCGPCSEIFYDHGPHVAGGPPGSPEQDGDRFVEIWNLVFMQFEQISDHERIALPKPSIDTGMGLERVSAVLEGVHNNFETSFFKKIIQDTADVVGRAVSGNNQASFRVIADHLRASSFMIADGILPSSEGRGYVLRRIMRRAMRHAHLLGAEEPLLHKIFPSLLSLMGSAYPELDHAKILIHETLLGEETRFQATLERGLRLLEEEACKLPSGGVFPGRVAFTLYDTYGFPLDLTQDALREKSLEVELSGFESAMAEQKEKARRAWVGSGEEKTENIWFQLAEILGPSEFMGYDVLSSQSTLKAIIGENGEQRTFLDAGEKARLVFDRTPFYAQSGGQVGDTGVIHSASGMEFSVFATQKKAGMVYVHAGELKRGRLTVGNVCTLDVDPALRARIAVHHSATHLLHAALRDCLGEHLTQRGSSVEGGRLRFDFSHAKPLSKENIAHVEELVAEVITQDAEVTTQILSLQEAQASGAMALFGEKYGDRVRVVAMGEAQSGRPFSLELCGGTHVKRTSQIGFFKIISEVAIASGVRRIEALAGQALFEYFLDQHSQMIALSSLLEAPPQDLYPKASALLSEKKNLEKKLAQLSQSLSSDRVKEYAQPTEALGEYHLVLRLIDCEDAKILKLVIDEAKKNLEKGIFVLIGLHRDKGKVSVVCGVTDSLLNDFNAVDLARVAGEILGGKGGGGRRDFAQAGGTDIDKAPKALEATRLFITEKSRP